jgi:drug/metabolite transporter (DMT)-like permease
MTQQNKAYLFAGVAVLMWSTAGSAFKLTLSYLEPAQMLLFASFISALALLVIIFSQKKWNLVKNTTRKQWMDSAVNSFLNPFLYYLILLYAYDILLAQEAMVLNYTWPVILTILSIFILHQKIGWKSFLAILISFAGIWVIATGGRPTALQFSNPWGPALRWQAPSSGPSSGSTISGIKEMR